MKKTIAVCAMFLMVVSIVSVMVTAQLTDSKAISLSLVNQDPDPAISGDVVEIRLGLENLGGVAAENLVLEILPEYPFTMVAGESSVQKVGTIKAYQTGTDMKIVKFKLRVDRDATAGEYELKIKEYEEAKAEVSMVSSITIYVKSRESAEVIYIDKTILVPGNQDSLTFIINNVGNAPLRDLTFSWINDDKIILPVGSDNTKYIKYIDVGESAELEYQVIADTNADAGLYELALTLSYDDPITGSEKEINTIAGLYVGGGTDFDIAFSESSSGQTSFTIANVGSNPAFSVSVIIPKQQGWSVTGPDSMIIGNLNTGDYTVASFALQSTQLAQAATDQQTARFQRNLTRQATTEGEGATSQQELMAQRGTQTSSTLKVQIAYTDTRGKRETVEKEVSMSQQNIASASTASTDTSSQTTMTPFRGRVQQQSFFSKYKWYIAVVVVLAVFGTGYWRYRKVKLLDQNARIRDIFKKKKK